MILTKSHLLKVLGFKTSNFGQQVSHFRFNWFDLGRWWYICFPPEVMDNIQSFVRRHTRSQRRMIEYRACKSFKLCKKLIHDKLGFST